MGTRGAYGFRLEGEDKVTYNHFDSYPTGLGKDLLKELSGRSYEDMVAAARRITLVDGQTEPTAEQIASLKKYANTGVSNQKLEDWYCLLREAQGTLEPWLIGEVPVMIDSHKFLSDSLFCEWAYIVNLDDKTFEVYKGFNKRSDAPGRYANKEKADEGYCGVALFKAIPLDDIMGKNEADLEAILTSLEPVEEEA